MAGLGPRPRKLLLASASFLSLFVGAEVAARVFGDFDGPTDPLITGVEGYYDKFRQYDPLLFWSLRPGVWGERGQLHINAHGLRGPEIPPKAPDEYRVLSLGESTTFAGRLDHEESYTALIEERLGEVDGKRVRAINGGVLGYSLFQGYQYLVHRGFALEPDAVLLYFGYNDYLPVTYLADRAAGGGSGLNDEELFDERAKAPARAHEFLVEHSHAYRALRSLLLGKGAPDETGSTGDESVAQDKSKKRVPPAHRRRLLEQALDACRARGVELVVIVPWYRKFEDHAPLLREFAAANDLRLIDLPTVLEPRLEGPRGDYFLDPVHPTAEGHRLIAEAVVEALRER